ncbi:histidine kinase [Agromyces sp. H66]|uniref:sensor histidine kinase n=1 Tax=Agromyces sp. H66 TaxID=2529859 RepID=UPI0010AB03FD|nr:histidine kinase [Agromyces sp. H66]
MTSPLRSVWDAPAATPPPPRRVWRDWVLVAALPPLVALEAVARPEAPGRVLWAITLIALVPTLLWRRTRPGLMLAIAFGAGALGTLATGGDPQLVSTAYFLILIYAVVRWGTGRAMLAAAGLVAASSLLSFALQSFAGQTIELADVIGALAVLSATVTLGVAFRWRAAARAREVDRIRLVEREQLARDLHDTVAHHVSAIAIQAQAGTAVAATDPDAAARVLHVIEDEASRTLDEMRSIVRMLRRDGAGGAQGAAGATAAGASTRPEHAPGPAIADLRRLDGAHPGGPDVDVRLVGDVDAVPSTVAAAVYRMAQESVTNARRHARNATHVDVLVRADEHGVRLDVRDDGDPAASAALGYGLIGMAERAALLGGTCEAGPAHDGGWAVTAVLPRTGWSA